MKTSHTKAKKPVLTNTVTLVKDLCSLSGKEIVGRILEHKSPGRVVQELPPLDFFWLVKRVGGDDCVPLLELASADQWQYLLDLELWRKDRLDLQQASLWLKRLYQADHVRLMRWLFSEGKDFAFYFFSKSIQVFVREEDEPYDLPNGFFCIDRGLYIRAINSEHRDTLEKIIRAMADEDFVQCRTFLLGLADLIPAEIEEEMYRLRNTRLGEHGFFPFEEALSVYASLDPKRIGDERSSDLTDVIYKEEIRAMVPVSPLYSAGANNIVTKTASRITDPLFVDRIRLEFAGLCNQILSADGLPVGDAEVLIRACRKAAGYLNLALEGLCGNKISTTEQLLRSHSLKSIFRVGFGLVLKLKWQAEQWFERSWFSRNGFGTDFWGSSGGRFLRDCLRRGLSFTQGPRRIWRARISSLSPSWMNVEGFFTA